MVKAFHIKNAQIWSTSKIEQRDLYCKDVILDAPAKRSRTIDLTGYTIYPGLVNAHDHLELNHFPRTRFREIYESAHQWGEDVNNQLNRNPYKGLREFSIKDRVFIGGLKNLLCGATTVVHHGAPYREMYRHNFPVRVMKNYGWSHSLYFETEDEVIASYQQTPTQTPWFIHLAEGTDINANNEYQRLKAMRCVGENTVIIHGVGLSYEDATDFYRIQKASTGQKAKIIICPTTNHYLLNALINTQIIAVVAETMIGSDSRLTASGDLLDEIRFASKMFRIHPKEWVINAITENPDHALKLNAGKLSTDYPADFIVLRDKAPDNLLKATRSDIALVVKDGIPRIGDPEIMGKFSWIKTVKATLDGVPKSINNLLAQQIQTCKLKETGLKLLESPHKQFKFF